MRLASIKAYDLARAIERVRHVAHPRAQACIWTDAHAGLLEVAVIAPDRAARTLAPAKVAILEDSFVQGVEYAWIHGERLRALQALAGDHDGAVAVTIQGDRLVAKRAHCVGADADAELALRTEFSLSGRQGFLEQWTRRPLPPCAAEAVLDGVGGLIDQMRARRWGADPSAELGIGGNGVTVACGETSAMFAAADGHTLGFAGIGVNAEHLLDALVGAAWGPLGHDEIATTIRVDEDRRTIRILRPDYQAVIAPLAEVE